MDGIATVAGMFIPVASFMALAVALFVFARNKGNIDALKEAAQTYKTLAEAYEAQIEHMGRKVERLEREITELKAQIQMQDAATKLAVDEILKGLKRAEGGT